MAKDFNQQHVVEHYDQHIRKLIPGYELIHLQVKSIVQHFLSQAASQQNKQHGPSSSQAQIVVVGCGTGYELQYLSTLFPSAKITAIDPAENMLKQAQDYLALQHDPSQPRAEIEYIHADSSVLEQFPETFDVAISILVSHFVAHSAKQSFFQHMASSLKPQGICLSYDLTQIEHAHQFSILKQMALNTGLAEAQAQAMLDRMHEDFYLISIAEQKQLYRNVGFDAVEQFAQVLNYVGMLGIKGFV